MGRAADLTEDESLLSVMLVTPRSLETCSTGLTTLASDARSPSRVIDSAERRDYAYSAYSEVQE